MCDNTLSDWIRSQTCMLFVTPCIMVRLTWQLDWILSFLPNFKYCLKHVVFYQVLKFEAVAREFLDLISLIFNINLYVYIKSYVL